MIRGVFSLAGLVILSLLLVRLLRGQIGVEDVAIRGLVIVACIAAIDKVVVPVASAAIRALSLSEEDSSPVAPSRGDSGA